MIHLVAVAHQAIVAGRFTILFGLGRPAQILPLFFEVAEGQGLGGNPGQGAGVVQQLAQNPGAPLSRFV